MYFMRCMNCLNCRGETDVAHGQGHKPSSDHQRSDRPAVILVFSCCTSSDLPDRYSNSGRAGRLGLKCSVWIGLQYWSSLFTADATSVGADVIGCISMVA